MVKRIHFAYCYDTFSTAVKGQNLYFTCTCKTLNAVKFWMQDGSDRFHSLRGSNHPSARRNAACVRARLKRFSLCAKGRSRALQHLNAELKGMHAAQTPGQCYFCTWAENWGNIPRDFHSAEVTVSAGWRHAEIFLPLLRSLSYTFTKISHDPCKPYFQHYLYHPNQQRTLIVD